MGLKPDEFWNLTIPDYNRMADGFQRRRREELEWRGTLMAHIATFGGVYDPAKVQFKRQDFLLLPGDNQPAKIILPTPEEMERINKRFNQ
ncbi:hypothetical protein [Fibrisoma montanum]|nr:hypothetical protein [Fibrisoma montanum]